MTGVAVWSTLPFTNHPKFPDAEDSTNVWQDPDGQTFGRTHFYQIRTTTNRP